MDRVRVAQNRGLRIVGVPRDLAGGHRRQQGIGVGSSRWPRPVIENQTKIVVGVSCRVRIVRMDIRPLARRWNEFGPDIIGAIREIIPTDPFDGTRLGACEGRSPAEDPRGGHPVDPKIDRCCVTPHPPVFHRGIDDVRTSTADSSSQTDDFFFQHEVGFFSVQG